MQGSAPGAGQVGNWGRSVWARRKARRAKGNLRPGLRALGSALRAQGALEPDGEPLRRAIGQGARGAKRRPSTGTLPGPPRIRTPWTCGPRASAKASGAWRSGRGVSGPSDSACRRQLPVPGPHPRGGVPLQGFGRAPTVGSETVSLVFRRDDFFQMWRIPKPQEPSSSAHLTTRVLP